MQTKNTIDLTAQFQPIYDRYPEYWRSPEAMREASQLWGNPPHNPHGVMDSVETLRVDLQGQPLWNAEIRIVEARNDLWAMSASYQYCSGGSGSFPSVFDCIGFTSRDAAIEAGVRQLVGVFESMRNSQNKPSANQVVLATRMVEHLASFQNQTAQLLLF